MSDYIDREAFVASLRNDPLFDLLDRYGIASVLEAFPAADVQPVVRGEWLPEKEDVEWGCSTVRYRCSHCGRLPHFDKESYKFLLSDYCPKCGADMRRANICLS